MSYEALTREIEQKKFAPVYYFFGDEAYFIDKLTKSIENQVLTKSEESFNKAVFYGAEANAGKLLNELRSFPMMSNHRLVLLKEAQKMKKDEYDGLTAYLENPVPSTVFVVAWKGKGLDGRLKAGKLLRSKSVSFESKPIYENQVGKWISNYVTAKNYTVKPEALAILVTYLGNNLGLIESELEKIFLFMKGQTSREITVETVYEMINIDKDFNVFELINALGARDHVKSHMIINQMMKNVKDHPPVLIVNQLFHFFNKIARIESKKILNPNGVASELKISPYFAGDYLTALKNYPSRILYRNLMYILEGDLFLKGIQTTHMSQEHVLKTLVFKLLN